MAKTPSIGSTKQKAHTEVAWAKWDGRDVLVIQVRFVEYDEVEVEDKPATPRQPAHRTMTVVGLEVMGSAIYTFTGVADSKDVEKYLKDIKDGKIK
jgi:hypothetical protein